MTLVGRIAGIHANCQVEQGEDAEHEHRAVEPENAQAGCFDETPGDEGQAGDDQTQQPGIALGVPPGALLALPIGELGLEIVWGE